MSEMKLWMVEASVEDDPYTGTGTAIVYAPNKTQAKKVGKEAIIHAYYESAGGWALKPLIREWEYPTSVEEIPVPEKANIVMASCHSDR